MREVEARKVCGLRCLLGGVLVPVGSWLAWLESVREYVDGYTGCPGVVQSDRSACQGASAVRVVGVRPRFIS